MIEGGCLCGEIRFAIDGPITNVSHCHCKMCQRMHGAAFATYGAVNKDRLHWLSGDNQQAIYRSSAEMERLFCKRCGSSLLCRADDEPDVEYIALGTIDGDPKCTVEYHIWVSSRAPWCTINDGLPQYEQDEPEA